MSLSKLWEIGRTEKPDVLQFMESQRVGHDLVTEKQNVNDLEYFQFECTILLENFHSEI